MKKKSKTRKALRVIVLSMLLIIIVASVYFNGIVVPIVQSVSDEEMRALTVEAVNSAVRTTLNELDGYEKLMKISYDNEGTISSISINSMIINDIMERTTNNVSDSLANMQRYGISIPIGSLSGIMFFAGKGPDINIGVVPVGSVLPELKAEFISVGINQTYHRIYLNLNTNVNIVIPSAHNSIGTVTEVSICENIIVGKIPETYLNSNSLQDMMDLIP